MLSHEEHIQEYDNLGLELVRLLKNVADIYTGMQVDNSFDDDESWNHFSEAIEECMENLSSFEQFLDSVCVHGNEA